MNKLSNFTTEDLSTTSPNGISWSTFKGKLVEVLNTIVQKINELVVEKSEIVVGTYVGTCVLHDDRDEYGTVESQFVNLGFTPDAVEIFPYNGQVVECEYSSSNSTSFHKIYGGMALNKHPCTKDGYEAVVIEENGFRCYCVRTKYATNDCVVTAKKDITYYFKAYKNCTIQEN